MLTHDGTHRRAVALGVVAIIVLAGASEARAQLSGSTIDTTGSTCSLSSGAVGPINRYCGSSAALLTNTPTLLEARYAWNINGDSYGICGLPCYPSSLQFQSVSGTAVSSLTFNAIAPMGYGLTIQARRRGDLNRADDEDPESASWVDITAVTGSSNMPLSSGSLDLPDPGVIGGSTVNVTASLPFDQTTMATLAGCSFGQPVTHTLGFTWSGALRSQQSETAVRLGQQNGSTTGCAACGYPGSPPRTQTLDGHFVAVTYRAFVCGDGVVDPCEECDLGATNGSDGACCTSSCTAVPAEGAVCGNGIVEACEQCDDGAANGGMETCCTARCTIARPGTTCRPVAGSCDIAPEQCDGVHATCPADRFYDGSTTCRARGGPCDVTEYCTGSSPQCPSDRNLAAGEYCVFGSGCAQSARCDGITDACPPQLPQPAGYVCRSATSFVCDVSEYCDGTSTACPADTYRPAGHVCRASAGPCDAEETCTGTSRDCPNNSVRPAGYVCRSPAGTCDVAETCTGFSGGCPTNGFATSSTVCRLATGPCDVAERCPGTGANCPADAFAPTTTECRADAGACDVAEFCDGAGSCPANVFEPAGTACGDPADTACDKADTCDASGSCLSNLEPSTTQCRADAGDCDVAEPCDGAGSCPADVFEPAGTPCGDPGDTVCDKPDACDASGTCLRNHEPSTTECRADAGDCDVAERCDGAGTCPGDSSEPAGTPCGDPSDTACDEPDTCDGSGSCLSNREPSTTECRASAGDCDPAENCTGSGSACPADAKSTAICRPSAGACDVTEQCDGASDTCPADQKRQAGAICRDAEETCDVAEACDGSTNDCPPDSGLPDGDGDDVCDARDNCDDASNAGQGDSDGDGAGDACDPCTNVRPILISKPKLRLTRLTPPAGDDSLMFKGSMSLPTPASVDPLSKGVRILVRSRLGAGFIDATISAGAYDPDTGIGWTSNAGGTTFRYVDASPAPREGIRRISLHVSPAGEVRFSAMGNAGSYAAAPDDLPLMGTFVVDAPVAATGDCGETSSTLQCTMSGGGSKVSCR